MPIEKRREPSPIDLAALRRRPVFFALGSAALVALIVLLAALFGVWTRYAGPPAVFWPANGLLLGLMVRWPALASPAGWLGAAIGYLAAGELVGDSLQASFLLALGNFITVLPGYWLMQRLSPETRRLERPSSMLGLMLVVLVSAVASGMAGSVIGPILFGHGALASGLGWFVSEIVNYIAVLPPMLTIPGRWRKSHRRWRDPPGTRLKRIGPLLALLGMFVLALVVDGPGALVFPVPALLWCGLWYGVFSASVLTMVSTICTLTAVAKGLLDFDVRLGSMLDMVSVRLGVTVVALSPITLAIAMDAHRRLLALMSHLANHDALTGILNRRAFTAQAEAALAEATRAERSCALLILDIDHFKAINDAHGHAAGDLAIIQVTERMRTGAADNAAVLGRLGGEEFALLLPGRDRSQGASVAERIRQLCSDTPIMLPDGRRLSLTVSLGASAGSPWSAGLTALLREADEALYAAKRAGRNRVVLHPAPPPLPA